MTKKNNKTLVDLQPSKRFELLTPGLQDQCSNHWATKADLVKSVFILVKIHLVHANLSSIVVRKRTYLTSHFSNHSDWWTRFWKEWCLICFVGKSLSVNISRSHILKENILHGFWYQRSISRHHGLSFKNGGKIGAVLICIQESAQTFTNYLRTTFVLVLIDGLASWYMIHVLLSVPQFESSRIEWSMSAKDLNYSRRNKNTSSKVHTETLCNFDWIF